MEKLQKSLFKAVRTLVLQKHPQNRHIYIRECIGQLQGFFLDAG